jgi:hypothetical protein
MADVLIVHGGQDAAVLQRALRKVNIHTVSLSMHPSNHPDISKYKALLVVWGSDAVGNDALQALVWKAKGGGKLFFTRVDDTEIPVAFKGLHNTIDLRSWEGSSSHSGFQTLVRGLETKLRRVSAVGHTPDSTTALGKRDSKTTSKTRTPAPVPPPRRTKIFLSYRRSDSEAITGRVCDRLVAAYGKDKVVFDVDSIPYGVDFREHIREEMAACHTLIAVISSNWIGREDAAEPRIKHHTDFVRLEIEMALEQNLRVIPVLVGATKMPGPQDLPSDLGAFCYLNAAPLDPGRDFHTHMDRLMKSIPKT